jgi:hypothetical protein
MARSNGPFGPAGTRPAARRHPGDDPFAAPPHSQSNGHWPPAQYGDPGHGSPQGQGYHFPPEPEPNFGYSQSPQAPFDGYQNGPPPDPYASQQWSQPDPRSYDLGSYMPAGSSQPYPAMDPPPFHHGAGREPYPQAYADGQQGYDGEGEYEDDFADEDEPGRGRRWMFIVAALVGAIGVGGALAYTYKSFVAPSGRVPLVKADPNLKVRPDNRNANDTRMQGRLSEEAGKRMAAAVAAEAQDNGSGTDESGGPRRVRTIPISPSGGPPSGIQVTPPAEAAASPPAIPGIMLENRGPPVPRAAPPQRVTIGQPPPKAQPSSRTEDPPPARKAEAPPPVVVKAPPPPQVVAKAPPPAPAPRAAASSGSGYVAVLSSQRTRMDALKAFADLQQKYGEALTGRVPDVQEANLGEKGIWYRVVVGPPGSRSAANGVCSQLKSAGYGHCWVNAY